MERTKNTDIRILTWNVLSEELTPGSTPISERMPGIAGFITENDPDAAGIQEISEEGYDLFEEYLGEDYELVNHKTKAGDFSFTGVMYNKKRYRLLDSDIQNYELGNVRIRLVNWIYIENIETGYRFVLLSTHWDRHACNRVAQAEHMASIVKSLEEKYGCGVIAVGDYNALEDSAAFKAFMRDSGYRDAKYTAHELVNNCFTGHDLGNPVPQKEGTLSIDHVTMNDSFDVLRYENYFSPQIIDLSDHLPVYVDLRIK
ncbi:MAG: endonuclease/exonuclease/phosphatase family protein [Eubacteriales bacterium]